MQNTNETNLFSHEEDKTLQRNYSIYDIANWFLQHVTCDQKKLQKLCYYAQAWHYAIFNSQLCTASFEAWVHGPVSRVLWDSTKRFEFNDLPTTLFSSMTEKIDDSTDTFLHRILGTYGKYSGFDLECLTHTEMPWIHAREGYTDVERCTKDISIDDMRNYYRGLIKGDGIGEG